MARASIDYTLQMTGAAQAVLALLPTAFETAPSREQVIYLPVEIRFWPFYNGRERGYIAEARLDVTPDKDFSHTEPGQGLLVSFSEARGGDQIFVQTQETTKDFYLDPPTISDFSEESYRERYYFPNAKAAAEQVAMVICGYILARMEAREKAA